MPSGVTFGAIRWDAWWDLSTGAPANYTRSSLSDADFQFRAPIHSQILAPNVITYQTTQQKFDDEISFAAANGLHYWAYLLYAPGDPMRAAINFHMSSSIASQMKFCVMVASNQLGSTGNFTSKVDEIVSSYISKSFYFALPSGKPLLYLYFSGGDLAGFWNGSIANLKAATDYLRSRIQAIKGVAPYFLVLCGADDATRSGLGADGVTNYIAGFGRRLDGTYAQLDASCQSYWNTMKNAVSASGGHIAPICMMGWNSTPRKRRPVSWDVAATFPEHGMRYKYDYPTNAEAAAHVQAAVTYVLANPTICPEKTILCYAWNENDEGGWLTKTLGDPTGSRLAAIAPVIA